MTSKSMTTQKKRSTPFVDDTIWLYEIFEIGSYTSDTFRSGIWAIMDLEADRLVVEPRNGMARHYPSEAAAIEAAEKLAKGYKA